MKKIFKEAHKMTRTLKNKYPNVDYRCQFGLCLKYLMKTKKQGEDKMRINVVTDKFVKLENFKEVETSRGTFNLPTKVTDEEMNITEYVEYSVWEKYEKCRIYMNGLGGYIKVFEDGTTNVVEKGQYAVDRRMQEAIGLYLKQ